MFVPDPAIHVPSEGWFGYGLTESNNGALWGSMGFLDFMGGGGYGTNSNNNSDWKVFCDVEVGVGGLVDGVVGDAASAGWGG